MYTFCAGTALVASSDEEPEERKHGWLGKAKTAAAPVNAEPPEEAAPAPTSSHLGFVGVMN